jgi:hypothetical protein
LVTRKRCGCGFTFAGIGRDCRPVQFEIFNVRPGARLRPLLYPDNFSLALGPRPKTQLIATLTAPSGDPIEIGLFRVVDLAARARTTLPGLSRTFANDGLRPSPPPSGR